MQIIVQKYFNDLRKKIRNETENFIELIKQKEKNELAKLNEFERSMNENLERRTETEPELKRLIDDLISKRDEFNSNSMPFNYDLKYDDVEGTLKRMRDEIEKLDVNIEAIMKEREELELKIMNENAKTTDDVVNSNRDFLFLFDLVHKER
jgi:chromosome segregation ATPase